MKQNWMRRHALSSLILGLAQWLDSYGIDGLEILTESQLAAFLGVPINRLPRGNLERLLAAWRNPALARFEFRRRMELLGSDVWLASSSEDVGCDDGAKITCEPSGIGSNNDGCLISDLGRSKDDGMLDLTSLVAHYDGDDLSHVAELALDALSNHTSDVPGPDILRLRPSTFPPSPPPEELIHGNGAWAARQYATFSLQELDTCEPFTDGRLLRLPPLRIDSNQEGPLLSVLCPSSVELGASVIKPSPRSPCAAGVEAMDSAAHQPQPRANLAPQPYGHSSQLLGPAASVPMSYADSEYQEAKARLAGHKRGLEHQELPSVRKPRLDFGHEDPYREDGRFLFQVDGPPEDTPPRGGNSQH